MLPVQHGLARKSPEYMEARPRLFPLAHSSLLGAYMLTLNQTRQRKLKFCRLCRACEEKWLEEHPIDWSKTFEHDGFK
jgi:hypothetical protein